MKDFVVSIQNCEQLLNFSQDLDINLLDNVVTCLYNGHGDSQKMAQNILTQLKEHQKSWTRVAYILESSTNEQTKYYALQILENVIKFRWKALPRSKCEGIRKYIVALVINTSQKDAAALEKQKTYLRKLNMILVQILKQEWPKRWPNFISEIVGASKNLNNELLCQNNMTILKLLSEEVFDFSIDQMTQAKAKHLKNSMCNEFSEIFKLCELVLEDSQNASLVDATLNTLLCFLNWIPHGYIFETQMVHKLIHKFLPLPMFRNVTLKCLTEIAGVNVNGKFQQQLTTLFNDTIQQLKLMLPPTVDMKVAYAGGSNDEQNFIQNLALFISIYLKKHGQLVEGEQNRISLMNALNYLMKVSEVDEIEIFKICLEYWYSLCSELYNNNGPRRTIYIDVLSRLRVIMISRMAKPEEVLVVENEQGEVVREFMKDTDSINLYKNMRETLVYLTHIDGQDTVKIMTEKLNQILIHAYILCTWRNVWKSTRQQ